MAKNNQTDIKTSKEQQNRFSEYFWANILFFAFMAVLTLVVWNSVSDQADDIAIKTVLLQSFKFMILLFGGGFLAVSLFDAAYDFFAKKEDSEKA